MRPGSGSLQAEEGRPGTLYIGDRGRASWESLAIARVGRINFGWPLYEGVGNEVTDYAHLAVLNLEAPNPLSPTACAQPYFRFEDLIRAEPLGAIAWPNPCRPSIEVPATDDVFVRERPAIDWAHGGRDARWAALDASGEPVALTLGTPEANGTVVSGSLFGGTLSVGGAWIASANAPPPLRDRYVHADSGGQWIKAFTFDQEDNALAVQDLIEQGGAIRALANDPQTGRLCYVTELSGSEVRCLAYSSQTSCPRLKHSPSVVSSPASIGRSVMRPRQRVRSSTASVSGSAPATRAAAPAPANSPTWSQADIGAVEAAGSYSQSGGTFTVKGSGADIWNNADAFQFVSQPLSGDGSITARVVSQSNTNGWAKAGVMFRETLAPGATNALAAITPSNGAVFQERPSTGAASIEVTYGPMVKPPYWLRVVRAGNTFSAYLSANGSTWTSLGETTITHGEPSLCRAGRQQPQQR